MLSSYLPSCCQRPGVHILDLKVCLSYYTPGKELSLVSVTWRLLFSNLLIFSQAFCWNIYYCVSQWKPGPFFNLFMRKYNVQSFRAFALRPFKVRAVYLSPLLTVCISFFFSLISSSVVQAASYPEVSLTSPSWSLLFLLWASPASHLLQLVMVAYLPVSKPLHSRWSVRDRTSWPYCPVPDIIPSTRDSACHVISITICWLTEDIYLLKAICSLVRACCILMNALCSEGHLLTPCVLQTLGWNLRRLPPL